MPVVTVNDVENVPVAIVVYETVRPTAVGPHETGTVSLTGPSVSVTVG